MSRDHPRGNREIKKPKQPKKVAPASSFGFAPPLKVAAAPPKKR
jgi:hypothetical protein